MVMKYFGFLAIAYLLFSGCSKNKVDVPAYLAIDSISLSTNYVYEGTASHKITDAWVYVDNNLVGIVELPAKIPISKIGKHQLQIGSGIKVNGITATRAAYPFYKYYIPDSTTFNREQTITINPVITYFNSTAFLYLEDFEGSGINLVTTANSQSTLLRSTSAGEVFEKTASGKSTIAASDSIVEIVSVNDFVLPVPTATAYLELNYKNQADLQILLQANYPSGAKLYSNDLVGLNPSDTWKKVYVDVLNLSRSTNFPAGAYSYNLVIRGVKRNNPAAASIWIDNLKIVAN